MITIPVPTNQYACDNDFYGNTYNTMKTTLATKTTKCHTN